MEIIKKLLKNANIRKAIMFLKKNGLKSTYYASLERLRQKDYINYENIELSLEESQIQKNRNFRSNPKFSILVPAFETKQAHLREMVASVIAQTYSNWELIIVDASASDLVEQVILEYKKGEPRIVYHRLGENKGISVNSNEALKYVTGDYVGLLDHDDVLTEDALFEMAKTMEEAKERGIQFSLLYSDEDKGDDDLFTFYEPHVKQAFNLDLLLSNNYICHFLVMKTELIRELGFRMEYDGAQDYDLILRAVHILRTEEIAHIPKVLYHWRCHSGSTAENPASKMYAYEAGKRALEDFCIKKGWKVMVSHTKHLGFYQIHFEQKDIKDCQGRYSQAFFEMREDVGAIGGRLVQKGKIIGGAYLVDGAVLYQGMNKNFSGYMHRASLKQNVAAVDLRCIVVKAEFESAYTAALERIRESGIQSNELTQKQYRQESLELCQLIRKKGYRILWDPDME